MKRKYNVLGTTFRYILPIPCESPCFFLTKNMSLNNLSSRQCIPVFQGADFINSSGSVENESPPTLTSRYINNDVHLNHDLVITPRKKGILFSVCLSVRPGRFFSFCARKFFYSFHHTQTKPILSERWVSGVCHGWSVFSYPQNIGEIGLWKRSKITNSNFWSVTSQRVLGLEMRYSCHMKALIL